MDITLGYTLAKPVATQAQCDSYAAMAQAVNDHNAACAVGDMLWTIEDKEDCYAVAEGGTMPEAPASEPSLQEQITALQTAQSDTDALTVDQEYRLTLLELGITDTDTSNT